VVNGPNIFQMLLVEINDAVRAARGLCRRAYVRVSVRGVTWDRIRIRVRCWTD